MDTYATPSSSRLAVFCVAYIAYGLGLPRSALPVAKGTYAWFSGPTYEYTMRRAGRATLLAFVGATVVV